MHSPRNTPPKPSPLLALVALAVAARLRPAWVAVDLQDAAREEGISPGRLSRLASRAISRFESVVAKLTLIGRPPAGRAADETVRQLDLTRGLLGVATAILAQIPLRAEPIRHLVVGAFERLRERHPSLTAKEYTKALGIPGRTFREWKRRAREHSGPPPPVKVEVPREKPPRNRGPRRPRFGFEVTLPDTQAAADTTNLRAFDVPLKLMASQDIGGRDADLLDGVLLDDAESAERIATLLAQTLSGQEGAQLITDQGTPYMAGILQDALEELEVEHAPQKEGDPPSNATMERAFGTVKEIAGPLLGLTNRLARAVPALARFDLARSAATLVLTMLLKAYQAGARAARRADVARTSIAPEALAQAAEESRERARARDRSARLLLSDIHKTYRLPGSKEEFVRVFRQTPLPVLREAEDVLAGQAHREDIRDRWAYFAKLVRTRKEVYQADLARRRAQREAVRRCRKEALDHDTRMEARRAAPDSWLGEALDIVAMNWRPERGVLLYDGVGLGTGWMRGALRCLLQQHGLVSAWDISAGVFVRFAKRAVEELGTAGIEAVWAVLEENFLKITKELPTEESPSKLAAALGA